MWLFGESHSTNKLNIVNQSNKQGNSLPCLCLVIWLQKPGLSTTDRAIRMTENPFIVSHGHKIGYLNWHYPLLQRIKHCIAMKHRLSNFWNLLLWGDFVAEQWAWPERQDWKQDATWKRESWERCGTGKMLMQLVLIEDKVEKLFKALRTDERRHKGKGKAEKNSLSFPPSG